MQHQEKCLGVSELDLGINRRSLVQMQQLFALF